MKLRIIGLPLISLLASATSAEQPLPEIRASSKVVTIIDGQHEKKSYWYIQPENSPEVYYVELPRKPHTVTFVTDLESISFPVTYGSRHRFAIRLDDGTRTVTEIRAEYHRLFQHKPSSAATVNGPAVIPFTLGDNDKIYVKGSINDSDLLDLQVDLGAGGTLIKEASVPKVRIKFDESIILRNSDGEDVVPSSSRNTITIAGLRWDDVPVAVANNMTRREDGIVGNLLFQDMILEIDYDRMVLVIHDTLPDVSGWQKVDMFLDGVVPFIRGTLEAEGNTQLGWFLLDTGAYTSILKHQRLTAGSKFRDEFRRLFGALAETERGPVISIGGHEFSEIMYSVGEYNGGASDLGIVGNDVMKRLNMLVDNHQGAIYLQPNGRLHESYRNPERLLARGVLAGVIFCSAFFAYRLVKRRASRAAAVTPER
jgi:hypothetical protein